MGTSPITKQQLLIWKSGSALLTLYQILVNNRSSNELIWKKWADGWTNCTTAVGPEHLKVQDRE